MGLECAWMLLKLNRTSRGTFDERRESKLQRWRSCEADGINTFYFRRPGSDVLQDSQRFPQQFTLCGQPLAPLSSCPEQKLPLSFNLLR
jgi:hypothetical protein